MNVKKTHKVSLLTVGHIEIVYTEYLIPQVCDLESWLNPLNRF